MTDFEDLYQRYARDVYRFALYLSGSPAQAEAFIAEDREFGARLQQQEAKGLTPPSLTLPRDHERTTLLRVQRRRARQSMIVNSLALLASAAMTAFYAWDVVPLWAAVLGSTGAPLPPRMQMAINASAWIMRLAAPLIVLGLPLIYAFRKRLKLPAFLESGTVLAVITGIALVLAQLCWLALLDEASISLAEAHRALSTR